MMTPEGTFADVANAAATAFAATPPYVGYRVEVRVDAGPAEGRNVVVRTRDGRAVVWQDGAQPAAGVAPGLPPAIDALAEWAFTFTMTDSGEPLMKIAYVRPKRFAFPSPGPQVDVVAANVQGYRIAFASDEPNELLLDPGTDAVRAIAKERDYFVFREVRFDPQTLLPISVTEAGPDERLALDYSVVNGVWLLSHFSYDAVVHAKRHSNDKHYHIEATYGNFTFPAGPPQG